MPRSGSPASPVLRRFAALAAALAALLTMWPGRLSAQAIHLAHMQLGNYVSSPTVTAARSGDWSQGSTWSSGAAPAAGAKVAIPAGVTVTVDREIGTPIDWIRVEGTLRFQPGATTALTAHTIVVMDSGQFEMGTTSEPVSGRAMLTLSSQGRDFNHSVDPLELTLGLIVMGQARIHGQPKTSWVPVSAAPQAGTTRVRPDQSPQGWQAGDRLVLTASTYGQEEDLTFQRMDGAEIVVGEPLKFARILPESGLTVHIGNLTRNVVIRSDPADAGNVRRQAHVMLMSDPRPHDIRYAEFRDLGRTTIAPVTDPTIVPTTWSAEQIRNFYGRDLAPGSRDGMVCPVDNLIPTENIRGRYALHFHHVGERTAPARHTVKGLSIHVRKLARLKFGFISHSSNVVVEDSVGYNIDGSTFMTEEGNEIGGFYRNLAVFSAGSNLANEDQPREILLQNSGDPYCAAIPNRRRTDMGHNGTGFWIHSGGLDTIDNVAAGHTNAGIDHWTKPLGRVNAQPNLRFETKYLRAGVTWLPGGDSMDIKCVPALYRNNIVYAAGFQRNGRKAGFAGEQALDCDDKVAGENRKTLIDGFTAWNVVQGVDTEYTSMTRWQNVRIIAGNRNPGTLGVGLRRQATQSTNELHDATIVGFSTCYELGDNGASSNVRCLAGTPTDPAPTPSAPKAPTNLRIIGG
jgi:hypothetical protein